MKIETKVTVLDVRTFKIKKGEKAGEEMHVAHFYDGEDIIKPIIPADMKNLVEKLKGEQHTIFGNFDMTKGTFHFKGIE